MHAFFVPLLVLTKLSVFLVLQNQIKTPNPENNYNEPENSWPALVLDSDVQNDGVEVTILAEPSAMTIYHVQPAVPSKKAIIVNHDSIGINSGRNRAICDQLSRDTGYHVLMPDFFRNGDGVLNYGGFTATGMSPEGLAWFAQMTSERVLADTELVYNYMTDAGFEIESYGSTGYCFGGWVGFHQATTGKISAHVAAHPSLSAEAFKNPLSGLEGLVKRVESPIMMLPAGSDPENVKEGGDVEQWLESIGQKVEVHTFTDMFHGWVPRGNVSIPEVARDVKLAMRKTVEFLVENM
jgi:dienelactone hydrolase